MDGEYGIKGKYGYGPCGFMGIVFCCSANSTNRGAFHCCSVFLSSFGTNVSPRDIFFVLVFSMVHYVFVSPKWMQEVASLFEVRIFWVCFIANRDLG